MQVNASGTTVNKEKGKNATSLNPRNLIIISCVSKRISNLDVTSSRSTMWGNAGTVIVNAGLMLGSGSGSGVGSHLGLASGSNLRFRSFKVQG